MGMMSFTEEWSVIKTVQKIFKVLWFFFSSLLSFIWEEFGQNRLKKCRLGRFDLHFDIGTYPWAYIVIKQKTLIEIPEMWKFHKPNLLYRHFIYALLLKLFSTFFIQIFTTNIVVICDAKPLNGENTKQASIWNFNHHTSLRSDSIHWRFSFIAINFH